MALIYGNDKSCARRRKRRTSENTLLTLAFLMGALGAVTGMFLFNHKTRKNKFLFLIPVAVIFNVAALLAIAYILQGGGIL